MLIHSATITKQCCSCSCKEATVRANVTAKSKDCPKNLRSPTFQLLCRQKHIFFSDKERREAKRTKRTSQEQTTKYKSTKLHSSPQAVSCHQSHPKHYPQLHTPLSEPCYVLIILINGPSANALLTKWLRSEQ